MPKITLTGQKDKERAVFCTISEKFLYIYFATGREAKKTTGHFLPPEVIERTAGMPVNIQNQTIFVKE